MSKLILYHGSPEIIGKPLFEKGKDYNDYGRGFYCTEHIELAKEWACAEGVDGYANRYSIETDGLKVLNLSSDEFTVLNWLAMLLLHRKPRLNTPVSVQGRKYLIENFVPDFEDSDLIVGYRADDSYFYFARSFVNNEISLHQLSHAMKLGKLGEQIVLKSKTAFDRIEFLDYTVADNSVYYAKRKARDEEAKAAYRKDLEADDINGIYMRDILREEIKPDDLRLQ